VVSIIGACCELLCFAAVGRATDAQTPLLHVPPPMHLQPSSSFQSRTSDLSSSWAACVRQLEQLALLCLTHLASVPSAHTSALRHVCHRLSIVCPEVLANPLISMLEELSN
jgi:hypothetical protein